MLRRIVMAVFLMSVATGMAACGDTWRGAREDTSENLKKAGDAVK